MTPPPTFQVLFYFSNESNGLVEVKRCDGLTDAPPERVFFWLYCDGERGELSKLDFRSMDRRGTQQQRVFAQGELCFDEAQARLRWADRGENEVFQVRPAQKLSAEWVERVRDFLRTQ